MSLSALAQGQQPDPNKIPPGGTNPPLVAPLIPPDTVQDFELEGRTLAAFAQATWRLTEQLEFTLGGRYIAIPQVCRALPGIRTFLDLPIIGSFGAFR